MESSDFASLQNKYPELGIGELSVIASAKSKIVFMEDRKAEKVAEKEGWLCLTFQSRFWFVRRKDS